MLGFTYENVAQHEYTYINKYNKTVSNLGYKIKHKS